MTDITKDITPRPTKNLRVDTHLYPHLRDDDGCILANDCTIESKLAFIVRAASSYQPMLEALEALMMCIDPECDGCITDASMVAGQKQNGEIVLKGSFIAEALKARKAIAIAKGEEQ